MGFRNYFQRRIRYAKDLVNQAKSRNGVLPSNGMNGPSLSDIIDDNETSITDTDINSN
jgi:hypothetical protein